MSETITERKRADEAFFADVRQEPHLLDVLSKHGFGPPHVFSSQHNSVFLLTKDAWTLPALAGQCRTLNIHFEARDRCSFRLDIGLEPYEGNIEAKPDLFCALKPTLERKAKLTGALRDMIMNAASLPASVRSSIKHLPAAGKTRTQTVVKFASDLPTSPTPSQSARFFAQVIEAIAPLVENVVTGNNREETNDS